MDNIRRYQQHTPIVDASAYVDASALVLGRVSIGADSSIWPMTVVRGDVNSINIGERSNIQDSSVLHVTHPHRTIPDGYALSIGNNVTVGHRVILHGCQVSDNCLIGMGSTIMDGAVVYPYVLVGAGSLVPPNKALESGYLWLGSPVKKIRELTDDERRWIDYSATHYVELKNQHLDRK